MNFPPEQIRHFLEISLKEAKLALEEGNYPIGSVIVTMNGEIIAQNHNQSFSDADVSAHAEILGVRQAGKVVFDTELGHHYLFTSLEPCFGCSFFLARTNIDCIVSALSDPHKGGIQLLKSQNQFEKFFSPIELVEEPFEDFKKQSKDLLHTFFINKNRPDIAKLYS